MVYQCIGLVYQIQTKILYQTTHEKHLHDAWNYITFITIKPTTFATKRYSRYSLQITSGEVERCG